MQSTRECHTFVNISHEETALHDVQLSMSTTSGGRTEKDGEAGGHDIRGDLDAMCEPSGRTGGGRSHTNEAFGALACQQAVGAASENLHAKVEVYVLEFAGKDVTWQTMHLSCGRTAESNCEDTREHSEREVAMSG